MTKELLKQADEAEHFEPATESERNLMKLIKALADEVRGSRHEKEYIYKQVERGLFDKHTRTKTALKNIAYYPQAPWSNDSSWSWDVTHKEYSAEFYKEFPLPQPPKEK